MYASRISKLTKEIAGKDSIMPGNVMKFLSFLKIQPIKGLPQILESSLDNIYHSLGLLIIPIIAQIL